MLLTESSDPVVAQVAPSHGEGSSSNQTRKSRTHAQRHCPPGTKKGGLVLVLKPVRHPGTGHTASPAGDLPAEESNKADERCCTGHARALDEFGGSRE